MKANRRGVTIPEVLITAAMLGVVMQLVITTLNLLDVSQVKLLARTEPRQQLRSFARHVQSDLRMASFIYPPDTYSVLGTNITVPDNASDGNGVIFAVPETSTTPNTFRVCYAYTRPREKPDSRNPDAYEAVYYYVEGVAPSTGYPSEIDVESLTGGSLRVFDAYMDGAAGFVTRLTPSGFGVNFKVHYKQTPIKGDTTEQKFDTTVVMRNGQ